MAPSKSAPAFVSPEYGAESATSPHDVERALQMNEELKTKASGTPELNETQSDSNGPIDLEPDPKNEPVSNSVPSQPDEPPTRDHDQPPNEASGPVQQTNSDQHADNTPEISPSSSAKQEGEGDAEEGKEEDGIGAVQTRSDASTKYHHPLHFADSAMGAARKVSRKLHLHRENERGPSEARQRRQSSAVALGTVEDVPLPWQIHIKNAFYGSLNVLFSFPYWDMAFWSGWSYTWGSVLFVIDGAWAWTPIVWPSSEFEGEAEYGVGLLFFFGAILYQIGATMAYLEAINDGSFAGRAMKRHLEGHDDDLKRLLDGKLHTFFGHMIPHHHHDDDDGTANEKQRNGDPEAGWGTKDRDGREPAPRRGGVDAGPADQDGFNEYLTWRWWPTWHAFIHYHIREMGYVACSIQLFGATLYGICGVISLPGILDTFSSSQLLGGYWIPQTVASCCFLTAGIMFTLITQDKWYRPLPGRIAWWIGAWAAIGSVGFLLSATFGICSATTEASWCTYQSSLSSMWGSFAYLTSSYLQWFESVNNGPVLAFPNNRVPTLMR